MSGGAPPNGGEATHLTGTAAAAHLSQLRDAACGGGADAQAELARALLRTGLDADAVEAAGWFRRAAEGGHVRALEWMCVSCRIGAPGVAVDAAEANAWGLRAAEGGSSAAQADMGRRLLRGEGIATDTVAGVALLRRAVDAGDLDACVDLGDAHAAGLGGLPVDEAAAHALYERAAAGGDATLAADARSRLHESPSFLRVAKRIALPAAVPAVCGHAACGAALDAGTLSGLCAGCRGVRYCDVGCQRAAWAAHRPVCKAAVAARAAALAAAPLSSSASPLTAPSAALTAQREEMEVWARMPQAALQAAAESGIAAAQGAIGIAYLHGTLGLEEDVEVGLEWLRKAASQGLLPARLPLGEAACHAAYDPGAGAAAQVTEALGWFRPLAEAGDAIAMYNAYVCCQRLALVCGHDGEAASHFAEAARWLRGAVALVEPCALKAVGIAAWDGDPRMGVARDRAEARRLYAAADAAGLPETFRALRPAEEPGSA